MKIALCQMDIAFESKEVNYIKAGRMIESAVEQGGELVLFPEMSFTGFSMNTGVTKEAADSSPTIHLMAGYAKRFGIAIGFGWAADGRENGELCENHYTVVDEKGELLADYVKIHPFSFSGEDLKFRGGREAVCFEFRGMTFGLALCYDLRFPELFMELSKKAEAIIVAANWPVARRAHWCCLVQARAIETQSYLLGVNCVGTQGGNEYGGDSMVVNPDGRVLITKPEEEIILIAEIEANILETRLAFPVRSDRKEALYRSWYEEV